MNGALMLVTMMYYGAFSEQIAGSGDFLLLDNTDFLLLNGTNFLLLGG